MWNVSTTSFSVELTSVNHTFFEYHHTAAVKNAKWANKVDSDTVYRIMSVTKSFNVDPAVECAEEAGHAGWYTTYGDAPQEAGFATPDPRDIPTCDGIGTGACSRTEMFEILKRNKLTLLPGNKAAYYQAFMLLGWAIEDMTGKSFAQLLPDTITKPLKLSATEFNVPDLSRGIIPVGIGASFFDPGPYAVHVGAPWEIFRISRLMLESLPIGGYTKSGSMPG
ncbi:hypothetical protein TOPH_07951 [Tolypocladium ophioglossoides CBS 100239]|uniref:Beta-lactamase-related domain-containing protein n=1 Tax=Tolypocladium ophioglossoides (strain CBS 100239) TaxID=1163406 RepID=A0A0L0N034_TOLOC|nr:hypothetical protein TOPH_07951 [Tolypocladium ophioglossoides CBS 100239]